jgi:metal-sulfur cluster biosynthetic enzyme
MDESKLDTQMRDESLKPDLGTPGTEMVNEGLPKSMPQVEPGSTEEQIKTALRQVYDPEIGLEVIQLGLIREIILASEPAEVKMMLTTPFCPYGGWLIQQIKDISEGVTGKTVKVTVLPDLWDPNYMEDPGLLMGW